MEKYFSGFFSIIFQPLLIPTYALILFFFSPSFFSFGLPGNSYLYLIMPFFLLTFIMPVVFLLYFKYRKVISSLRLENRKERSLPYIITFVFYFSAYYSLRTLDIQPMILLFILGSTIIICIALIVNIWWKISAHMLALGGFTGTLISLSLFAKMDIGPYIICAIIISGLTAYSRLYEKAHTALQVYIGYLVGLSFMIALSYYAV